MCPAERTCAGIFTEPGLRDTCNGRHRLTCNAPVEGSAIGTPPPRRSFAFAVELTSRAPLLAFNPPGTLGPMTAGVLPPGQSATGLERFGLPQFAGRRVVPPVRPVLSVTGQVRRPAQLDLADLLAGLPRRQQRSDLHCVTTWSAVDLVWSGVAFREVLRRLSDVAKPHTRARWLLASGLDGFAACLRLDDALADDVLLAEKLYGVPLSLAHGAPIRLVAPAHYGYKSVKHLVTLEYRSAYPGGSAGWKEHPRGRVANEERSRVLPGPLWRRAWSVSLPLARRPYRRIRHDSDSGRSPDVISLLRATREPVSDER